MPDYLSDWFTVCFGKPVILVRVSQNIIKSFKSEDARCQSNSEVELRKNTILPAIHMMNLATINEIQSLMEAKYPILPEDLHVSYEQYKANILIDMKEPWIEDYNSEMRVGCLFMRFSRPCFRCKLLNMNIKTFKSNKCNEPTATLNEFRWFKGVGLIVGTYFGSDVI